MKNKIEFIAFDSDYTLCENELYFQELEHKICHLLMKYSQAPSVSEELCKTEIKNLHIYGYGLKEYFCHIEIMSDKKNADYKRLLDHLGCKAENLLMIGNSIKSDIIPILELGGYAAYVPHHVTWAHEQYEGEVTHSHFIKLNNIKEIQNYL